MVCLIDSSVPSSNEASEEAVIAVDITSVILVDSQTNMCDTPIPPDLLTLSPDGTGECQDDNTRLTLAYENLYEIPRTIVERFSEHIMYLDISHNKITNLEPLVHFKHLTSLIADHNPITENCSLPPLPQLQLLWLNHCKIASLYPWVSKLKQSCPHLQYLCLMDNPAAPSFLNGGTFYEYLQYRLFVISQFPTLKHLDDRKITEYQISEARRLYKRPLLERLGAPSGLTWSTIRTMWSQKKDDRNLLI